jgi:hypothetical protein
VIVKIGIVEREMMSMTVSNRCKKGGWRKGVAADCGFGEAW